MKSELLAIQHLCNPLHIYCRLREVGEEFARSKTLVYEQRLWLDKEEVYLRLVNQIKQDEGLRLKPYMDSEGVLTIGYGLNLNEGITEEEAEYLLISRVSGAVRDLLHVLPISVLENINGPRWAALLNMLYNLGLPRFLTFRRMLAAIRDGRWEDAAREALDSRWARQVGARAHRIARMLETGEW